MPKIDANKLDLEERVIKTNKCQKTHKGGRTMSWNALVVVGDNAGHVGVGLGKARGVPDDGRTVRRQHGGKLDKFTGVHALRSDSILIA